MKKVVYQAPTDRDFISKVVSGTTYLDCLSGHTLNPDVQVKFDVKMIPKISTDGFVLDGDVHTTNPRYTSTDPDDNPWHAELLAPFVPLESGTVDFSTKGFPILPAFYDSSYRFENQRNQIESNSRQASTLLPYLVPRVELNNSLHLVTNVASI